MAAPGEGATRVSPEDRFGLRDGSERFGMAAKEHVGERFHRCVGSDNQARESERIFSHGAHRIVHGTCGCIARLANQAPNRRRVIAEGIREGRNRLTKMLLKDILGMRNLAMCHRKRNGVELRVGMGVRAALNAARGDLRELLPGEHRVRGLPLAPQPAARATDVCRGDVERGSEAKLGQYRQCVAGKIGESVVKGQQDGAGGQGCPAGRCGADEIGNSDGRKTVFSDGSHLTRK